MFGVCSLTLFDTIFLGVELVCLVGLGFLLVLCFSIGQLCTYIHTTCLVAPNIQPV